MPVRYLETYAPMFSASPAMRSIKEIVEDVADTDATVLIRGESGVGKDLIALENAVRRMVVLTDGEQAFEASTRQQLSPPAKVHVEPAPTEGPNPESQLQDPPQQDFRMRTRPPTPPVTVKFSSQRILNYTVGGA